MILKSRKNEIFDIFFGSAIKKNLKQETTEIHFFLSMYNLQIIRLFFVCWSIFNKTLWFQIVRKIKFDVRYKTLLRHQLLEENFFCKYCHIIYHSKSGVYHFLLKYYNLKVYQRNDLETNTTFSKSLKLETV